MFPGTSGGGATIVKNLGQIILVAGGGGGIFSEHLIAIEKVGIRLFCLDCQFFKLFKLLIRNLSDIFFFF